MISEFGEVFVQPVYTSKFRCDRFTSLARCEREPSWNYFVFPCAGVGVKALFAPSMVTELRERLRSCPLASSMYETACRKRRRQLPVLPSSLFPGGTICSVLIAEWSFWSLWGKCCWGASIYDVRVENRKGGTEPEKKSSYVVCRMLRAS